MQKRHYFKTTQFYIHAADILL